jgi:hypothetical protein
MFNSNRFLLVAFAALALAVLVFSGSAGAATPSPAESIVVLRSDGSIGEPVEERLQFVRSTFRVVPNIVGIARRPDGIDFPRANRDPTLRFAKTRFEPREGFDVDADGNIIVDPDPNNLSYFWYGRSGKNHLLVTVNRGRVQALLFGPGLRYTISAIKATQPVMRELDANAIDSVACANDRIAARQPPKADDTNVRATGPAHAQEWTEVSAIPTSPARLLQDRPKHTTTITLMFYYTPQALAAAGGQGQLQTKATSLIDELNTALLNSGDPYYVRFEQQDGLFLLPSYNETPSPFPDPFDRFSLGHLLALRNYDDEAANSPTRATQGTDFAVLLVADPGEPNNHVFGASYTQRHLCSGFFCHVGDGSYPGTGGFSYRNSAYAVVSIAVTAANYTFAHEVGGHMMGGGHDPNPGFQTPRGAFTFSYGYRIPGVVRDITADPECVASVCSSRQLQFANPRIPFIGSSSPSGTTTRDVARTITCLADYSANLYPFVNGISNIFKGSFEQFDVVVPNCPPPVLY